LAEITAVSIADILGSIPEIVPWEGGFGGEGVVDVLVCCAGFEDRSTAICLDLGAHRVKKAVVIRYATNASENEPALAKLRGQSAWEDQTDIVYDRATFLGQFRKTLQNWRGTASIRVIIDLSVMASYVIYRVLSAFWEELPQARLAIYYAEAVDYSPKREEWDAFYKSVSNPDDNFAMAESYEQTVFQARGVDVTYESDAFPGQNVGPMATEVIAVPSFSLQRMKSMLAYAESHYNARSTSVRWFLGQPPDRARNGWRFDALAALYNVRDHGAGVSTRDYRDILQRLDSLWEQLHTSRHLLIANLGSKMQHLGCFLFLAMHGECGLVLCEPQEYIAGRYSRGVGPRWWLDFGELLGLRRVLESRGNLEFHWPTSLSP
jgi:hypothetical protein